jgi:Ca2+/Na+ antiporter
LLSEVFRAGSLVIAFALGSLIVPILFIAWSYPLLKGQEQIPKRTKVMTMALIVLSAVFLVISWPYGIEYQGVKHTIIMYLFNFCFWYILFRIYRANTRQISFITNFLFHWITFAWLGWVAFPWLGELL